MSIEAYDSPNDIERLTGEIIAVRRKMGALANEMAQKQLEFNGLLGIDMALAGKVSDIYTQQVNEMGIVGSDENDRRDKWLSAKGWLNSELARKVYEALYPNAPIAGDDNQFQSGTHLRSVE